MGFLAAYALIALVLAHSGEEVFEHLHLLLDSANGILSLLLAIFLAAEHYRIEPTLRKCLIIVFGFTAATEILHALVGIEWTGSMSWVREYAHTVRPATWPPSAYILPLGLAWLLWQMPRQSTLRPAMFAAGIALLTLVLISLGLALPKYVDTGILGIQRPTQVPLILLLLAVIVGYWRRRYEHPIFEGVALMSMLLLISDLCMLYSTAPHEKFAMMAHAGKLLAYMLLHTIQMRVVANDSRARALAETALLHEQDCLRHTLAELNYQKFALDQHAIVSTADLHGTIVYANEKFCALSGYTAEELLGQNHRLINSKTHPKETFGEMYRAALAGQVWRGEICNRSKDGRLYWVMNTVLSFADRTGQAQFISIGTEISALKAAESAIKHLNADLEHRVQERTVALEASNQALRLAKLAADDANDAKSRFLAAASHDLRQPLSAIKLYVGMLKNTPRPSDQKVVANMQECIDSLSTLLNDLLDLSKLAAGVVTPSISDFSVADVLDSMKSHHAPEAAAKGLRLQCVPSGLTGRTDPVLFRRLLSNLVENALRYTERGGVVIGCRRRQGKTWVEVWDTGIGIPADQTSVIFEDFKQLGDGARNKGSGLGLAIVAKSAALLGLGISVNSRPGHGSVFAVELPLGESKPGMPPSTLQAAVSRPLRIALVEDNPMVRDALVAGLQSLSHQVFATASKSGLLAELQAFAPDIVVSDYRLERGETGTEVIAAARSNLGANLPAILITGDTDPDLLRGMSDSGIALLHKPVDLEDLQAYLEELTYEVT